MAFDVIVEIDIPVVPIIIFIVAPAIIGLIFLIVGLVNRSYKTFVRNHSVAYLQLKALNDKYNFYPVKDVVEKHEYDNKYNYENVSCYDYAVGYIKDNFSEFKTQITNANANHELFYIYAEELSEITIGDSFDKDIGGLRLKKLLKIQDKIFNANIKKPKTYLILKVVIYQTKINGDRLKSKYEIFKQEQIEEIIKKLKDRSGKFYNDYDTWMSLVKYERGRVSNKLRFAIYQRDKYRCCNCGKRGHNDLEIDHIIPISKGGKTEYNNLQTLCRDCNQEKGNKINW